MTQLSPKEGLKEWVEKVHSSAKSNMKQIHLRNTFITIHRRDLTYEVCQMVLESHMFLKNKRDSKIKGRNVSGGNKQNTYIPKEDVSYPTVSIEYVLLTRIVDAKANMDLLFIDTPNAFIHMRV